MIDVIIPAYRGLAETRRCLESVLGTAAGAPHEVVVIDDASPEPEISAWLRGLAEGGRVTLVAHAQNRGFVASVNEGMRLHPDRDVVLLNSDTEVAEGWLGRLAACAGRDERTGTVTPFSNNASICGYPDWTRPNALPDGIATAELDRIFREVNDSDAVEIPTAVGFCMFIARRCLAEVGPFDEAAFGQGYGEEVDFCMRAARAGYRHLLCADTFVYHRGEVSFGSTGAQRREEAQRIVDARYPEFLRVVRDFISREPAAPLRDRVTARLAARAAARAVPLPADLSRAGTGPVVAIFATGPADRAAAERTLRSLALQSVLPDVRSVVVTGPPGQAGAKDEEWARLASGGQATEILPAGTPPDLGARLRELADGFPGRDIAVVAPGAQLPYAWDARLRKAAHAAPGIGAAAPMCDAGPAFSLVDKAPEPGSPVADELVDRIAFCLGDRTYYEVPGLPSACAYFRRDALDAVLAPAAAIPIATLPALVDDLSGRLRTGGLSCVLCDYLYVAGAALAASPGPGPGDAIEASALAQHHPLGGLRRAVNAAIARGLPAVCAPGLDPRPVRLHITHYWGGGLDKWVRDFARADPAAIHMTLASYRIGETGGQRIVLSADPAAIAPIRTWDIARPIRSTAAGSVEYRRILDQVVAEFEVETVIVSSLIGHALDALDLPLPTIVVCHDFYPVCQAINPQFRKTCERCTRDDLRLCARDNPLNRTFTDLTSEQWDAMRARYVSRLVERRIEMVVPSPWVADTLRRLEPRLRDAPIRVIGHGIDMRAPRVPAPSRSAGERLRLVVLGRLSVQKGTELLRQAHEALRPLADVTLVGGGGNGARLAQACGWKVIEGYREEELPDLLAQLAPHAAVLASVVPETFSYTLSELFNLGIPPVATALGAFRERIVHGETGFLFEPDAPSLAALVEDLHARPERLAAVASRLAARAPEPTTSDMVAGYRPLLPVAGRPVARFRVGIGTQTGLSEPYRHLNEAYSHLSGAYDQSRRAYDGTRAAYERATAELAATRSLWEKLADDIKAMRIGLRWWLAPLAAHRVAETRAKMNALPAGAARADGAGGADAPLPSPPREPGA